jgi:hypothetical protein
VKVRKGLVLLLILSATLIMFLASFASVRSAPSQTAILTIKPVNPADITFYANYTTLPATITFNLTITSVTNLFTWQAAIQWDKNILNYSSLTFPADNVLHDKNPVYVPATQDTLGLTVFGANCGAGQTAFNGSGVLAQLTLIVNASDTPPASTLVGFEGMGVDTFLLSPDLANIDITTVTTTFNYVYDTVGTVVTHTITGTSDLVVTSSNGTVAPNSAEVDVSDKTISFNVTGNTGDISYLYMQFPMGVINVTDMNHWNLTLNGVLVYTNGTSTNAVVNGIVIQPQITANATFTSVYIPEFAFASNAIFGTQGDNVIPELSNVLIVMFIVSSVTVAIVKGKTRKRD